MIKLNLGCGLALYKDWINVDNFFDKEELVEGQRTKKGFWQQATVEKGAEFVRADIRVLPFKDNYADYVLLDNVIEHIAFREVPIVLKEIYRVMKKGATFKLITPDMDALALSWLKMSLYSNSFQDYDNYLQPIVGSQTHEGEYHKCLFNAWVLNQFMVDAGFKDGRVFKCLMGAPTQPDGIGLREKKRKTYGYDWLVAIVTK